MLRKKTILPILIFICFLNTAFSQTLSSFTSKFDPSLEWKSIETDHFWIHYHQGLAGHAVKLAEIAENVHARLVKKIKWEPYLKTDVVLVDNFFTANGSATPLPYNRIQIYVTRPELDGSLNNFNNWLELVFTHEYTHILNLDTINGFPSITRYTCGRCCFPNLFIPVWMLEGNAVYTESIYSVYGRNNSTYTDMVLRTEIYNDNLKSLSKASTYPREWPSGSVPYLYGGLFIEFLERKYGKGNFDDVFIANSYNLIPYRDNTIPYILPFIDSSTEYVYGESVPVLWNEWEEFIKIKYKSQISKIEKQNLTKYSLITKSGSNTVLPRFSRDGEAIYYIRNNDYSKSGLMKHLIAKGQDDFICRVNYPNSIAVSEKNEIYLSDAEFYKSYSIYNEAFRFNDSGSYEKLTSGLKGSYIDITKDSKKTILIKQADNNFSLLLTDPDFQKGKALIDTSDIQIAFPKFSPDGNRVVFSFKDRTGYTDLAIYNINDNSILRLTEDEFNDITPAWHPDGKKIIFSSDRDGIYNLYELDMDQGITRLSNLIGGAFNPDISPDGTTIAFALYGKDGFDIAIMQYPENNNPDKSFNITPVPADFFIKKNHSKEITEYDYSIWNSVLPPFWIPLAGSMEMFEGQTEWLLGFYTLGTDTLYKHSYALSSYAYTFEKRTAVSIGYMLSSFRPDIILEYYDDTLFFDEDRFPWKDKNEDDAGIKRTMERYGAIGIAMPFLFFHSYHLFSCSYSYEKEITDEYSDGLTANTTEINAKIRCKYYFNNAEEYSYSISPENGREFYIISDNYHKNIGADYTFNKVMGKYSEYLPGIFRNNVTMLQIRGGSVFKRKDYQPYPLGRFEKGKIGSTAIDDDELGLRGYSSGNIYGSRLAAGTIEYRFPIIQADLGYATIPLMFRDLWINSFYEYGSVWDGQPEFNEFKSSAGIELNLRITIGYWVSIQGYIGYAHGFDKDGEDQVYFAVSTLFEGALKDNYKWIDYL